MAFNASSSPFDIEIRRIPWQQTIALRHAVLWPGEDPAFCHVEGDDSAWHFGAFAGDRLVSVASVFFDGDSARLRKFATEPAYQRQGIGTQMVRHVLVALRAGDIRDFWCDAREAATGFYGRFGMQPEGGRFYKGDVPYRRMRVQLG